MLLISFSYTTADDNQAWIPANGDTDSGVGLGFLEFDFGHIFKGREEASTTTTTTTTTLAPAGGGGGVSKYDENIIFVDYPFGRPIYVEGMEGVFIKKKIKFFNLRDEELKLNYNFLGVNCVLNKTFDTIEAHSTTEVEMLCLTENADDIDMFTVKDSLGVDYERQVRFKRDTMAHVIIH